MFEDPMRTKSKLTDPSNDVLITLASGRYQSRAAVLAKIANFSYPCHLALFLGVTPFECIENLYES